VGYDELDFLGHTLSAKGVRISDSKVKAIKKMTAPTNRKRFEGCGLMHCFRRHVANYSVRTYHMRQLLKPDTKFTCTQDCQNELEDIKQALTNAPILAPFRNDRKVYLYTDGSVAGMGLLPCSLAIKITPKSAHT